MNALCENKNTICESFTKLNASLQRALKVSMDLYSIMLWPIVIVKIATL